MKETRSYFEMLLYAAFESSTYRVVQAIRGVDAYTVAKAYDAARTACRKLGHFCKQKGVDARMSPLYEDVEFKSDYVKCYEYWRNVVVDELSPAVIFEVTERTNHLAWQGFGIYVFVKDYPSWANVEKSLDRVMIITGQDGEIARFEGDADQAHDWARRAYRLLTGRAYSWEDGLPLDHSADLTYLAQT
jgi:hypothetical protein